MLITRKNDPLQNTLIMRHIKLVDIHTTVNHLDPYVPAQRKVRDVLTGADMAGLFDYTGGAVKQKLIDELEDALIQETNMKRCDLDTSDLEFADVYDAVREQKIKDKLKKYPNSRVVSCTNSFWGAGWGVYAEAMVTIAKLKIQQQTLFGQFFTQGE